MLYIFTYVWVLHTPNNGRNTLTLVEVDFFPFLHEKHNKEQKKKNETKNVSVKLKSNLALLYNKGHNLLTSAFPSKHGTTSILM